MRFWLCQALGFAHDRRCCPDSPRVSPIGVLLILACLLFQLYDFQPAWFLKQSCSLCMRMMSSILQQCAAVCSRCFFMLPACFWRSSMKIPCILAGPSAAAGSCSPHLLVCSATRGFKTACIYCMIHRCPPLMQPAAWPGVRCFTGFPTASQS